MLTISRRCDSAWRWCESPSRGRGHQRQPTDRAQPTGTIKSERRPSQNGDWSKESLGSYHTEIRLFCKHSLRGLSGASMPVKKSPALDPTTERTRVQSAVKFANFNFRFSIFNPARCTVSHSRTLAGPGASGRFREISAIGATTPVRFFIAQRPIQTPRLSA